MSHSQGASGPPRRFSMLRHHKALVVLVAMALVLAVAVGGWLVFLSRQLGEIPRFDADLDREGRPQRVAGAAVNILLAGVDDGRGVDLRGMLGSGDWQPGVFRSDTIVVLHVAADCRSAQLLSIPRDSYVRVPGHGRTKINAAFSYGGPGLLVHTVEDLTRIRLDHVAVVDLEGFRAITEAVEGVTVTVPQDGGPRAGESLRLEGEEALAFVRERTTLPKGDLDRIRRQHAMLRGVLGAVTSRGVLANPVRLTGLVDATAGHLAVDETLTDDRLRGLVLSCRGLRATQVRFLTVPVRGIATIAGASVVLLQRAEVRRLFAEVAEDAA